MRTTKIKTFKRFMKEEREKYYAVDLQPNMSKEDVIYIFNELIPLTLKMLKNGPILITVEPKLDGEEE